METLDDFAERLSRSVGCFPEKNKNRNAYSLKKYNDTRPGHMGVFAWVAERVTKNRFVISTYESLVNTQAIADADKIRPGAHYASKKDDPEGKATGLSYYVERASAGADYDKAVRALRIARNNKP